MKQIPDVYVCSKPLQYFNIKNIGEIENSSNDKILIVIGAFYDAKRYVEHIKEFDKEWSDVLYMADVSESQRWLFRRRINNLFVENDASWKIFLIYILRYIRCLYVYEEGIGSYKGGNKHGLEALIRKIIGIGNHNGDSKYCKGIFLSKPWLYNQKFKTTKGRPFCSSFKDCIQKYEALFEKLTGSMPQLLDVKYKHILIYVTEWDIHQDVLERMESEAYNYDLCLIKPHPHIKILNAINNKKLNVLQTQALMEMILYYLLKRNNHVTVWHHCSTSVIHFLGQIRSELLPICPENKKIYIEYINA